MAKRTRIGIVSERLIIITKNVFEIKNGVLVNVLDKSITEAVIPNNTTSIGDYAFEDCNALKSVIIPDSITKIGTGAFYQCNSLTRVIIPESVTSVGYNVFAWCTSLTSVIIGNGITTISNSAFYGCTSLTNVIIPDSITSINNYAFYDCSSLTSITIPKSMISIGWGAFANCCQLKSTKANYKAFNLKENNMSCRNFPFKENEWSDMEKDIIPCERGYHFRTNLFEIFNDYSGIIDKDIVIYECQVGDKVVKTDTSVCVTNTIKPVKRLYREDALKLLNV